MKRTASLLTILWLVFPAVLLAENAAEGKAKDPEFSQQGLLAGTAQGATGNTQLGGWGAGSTGGPAAPIGGSVSKDGRNWKVRVVNNSEDTYRANFDAVQLDKLNKKLKSNPFSATLKGGEKLERVIKAHPTAQHCNLQIKSWKKVGS
ncbi:MAG: hypothetical protein KDD62_15030 [Bdellovibrionales bacterium]|nr:hypothetical protein [Bdellovibrionales bacterium]